MRAPEIVVLGQRLRPLESVTTVGCGLLGLKHGAAYRAAATWPTTGDRPGARKVIVPRLLEQLGIPYEVVSEPDGCQTGDAAGETQHEDSVSAVQSGCDCECPRDCVSLSASGRHS